MKVLFLFFFNCFHIFTVSTNDWSKYLEIIRNKVELHQDCDVPDDECQCHESLMNDDLHPWSSSGITKKDFDIAKLKGVHYQIINHRLYRQKDCLFPFRCSGIEHFIFELIDGLPNMEFSINTHDYPQTYKRGPPIPVFSFSKVIAENWDITYPAWTFWEGGPAVWPIYPTGLGRWDQQRTIINDAFKTWPWEKKLSKAFFRGSRTSEVRDPLILLSRAEPDLVDAQYTKNQAWKSDKDTLGMPAAKELKLEDHCSYKYLFNFRGVAASFRLKHLFLCGSLVFHVGDEWIEFFYPSMMPWVHYIPVQSDLSDAKELIEFARNNDEVVKKIANRGRNFIMQHLRMKDVSCYWEKLLLRYAVLSKWNVVKDNSLVEIIKKKRDEL